MFGDDDSFWTRDDLDEFVSELEDTEEFNHFKITIYESYIEDNNMMELGIKYNDYELSVYQKIDMRKIKSPNDLRKIYIPIVCKEVLVRIYEMLHDIGEETTELEKYI